jgi:hypothetical protein
MCHAHWYYPDLFSQQRPCPLAWSLLPFVVASTPDSRETLRQGGCGQHSDLGDLGSFSYDATVISLLFSHGEHIYCQRITHEKTELIMHGITVAKPRSNCSIAENDCNITVSLGLQPRRVRALKKSASG